MNFVTKLWIFYSCELFSLNFFVSYAYIRAIYCAMDLLWKFWTLSITQRGAKRSRDLPRLCLLLVRFFESNEIWIPIWLLVSVHLFDRLYYRIYNNESVLRKKDIIFFVYDIVDFYDRTSCTMRIEIRKRSYINAVIS